MLYDEKRWSKQEVTTEEWRLILLRAADILEKKGWIRYNYQRSGRYCAMGAINKASGKKPSNDDFDVAEREAIWRFALDLCLLSICTGTIMNWNDDVAKSGAEVVARMRKVANEH